MPLNLKIGSVYTFNTVAPAVLGARKERVKLVSILDYNEATRYENIYLKHRQLFSLLPPNTPDDPRVFIYYRFKTENNESLLMAEPWIVEGSLETITTVSIFIRINNANISDVTELRDVLTVAGYNNFEINTTAI